MAQRKRPTPQAAITLTHPNAAGIDIGSASHFVAVPPDRDEEPVREFHSFTADLHRLADWLDACGVDTVAMESTGMYWIPLFELLESRGFSVLLVNARHVKNVSGRKSDVLDCQWQQQLMGFGLLHGAFRPAEQVCVLRSLTRQRQMILRNQARFVPHMQKALTQMNIQLANTISDVVGETGQKILRAIVAGERDGMALAKLKNGRIHVSLDEIARSLQGNWPNATRRSRPNCQPCMSAKSNRPKARSALALATHPSLICAPSCFKCGAWISRASMGST